MGFLDFLKKKDKEPVKTSTPAPSYSGPVQPGTSEKTFRESGTSEKTFTPAPSTSTPTRSSGGGSSYSGPVQPGTSEKTFRESGESTQIYTPTTQRKISAFDPSEKIITGYEKYGDTSGQLKSVIDIPESARTRTSYQDEFLKGTAFTRPDVFTKSTDTSREVTLGEIQFERESKRKKIEDKYQENIQKQFDLSGMGVTDFMASSKYKDTTAKANIDFDAVKDVKGLSDSINPDFRSGVEKTFEFFVPTKRIGEFIESESRWSDVKDISKISKEERTKEQSIDFYETIYEGRDTRVQKAHGGLLDIGLIGATVVAPLVNYGTGVGRTALQKSLAKQISIGTEKIGQAQIISGEIVNIGAGRFGQQFTQKAGTFARAGIVEGTIETGAKGMQFIPSGTGQAFTVGTAELTGAKKIAANILGTDTRHVFKAAQTFDIAAASSSYGGAEVLGFETSRTIGLGTFSPVKSGSAIFDVDSGMIRKGIFQEGGETIMSEFATPMFTKQFPKGSISMFETKGAKGIQIVTDLAQFKPSVSPVSFARDKTKVAAGRVSFLDNIKSTSIPKIDFKPSAPSKGGLITELKTSTTRTPKFNIQTSKTIQGGLARTTRTPYKPFSFQTPKLGVSSKAVMGLGLGSRGIISGFSGSKIGTGVTSLKTTGLISGSAIASLSGTASSLTGGGIVSTITTGVIGGGGVIGGIGTGLKLPPFNLPKPSLGTPGGIGKIGAERFFKYTPSFAALKFGITSTKKTKGIIIGGREVYSGLTTRAIVKKRKIKKKTKKKSK